MATNVEVTERIVNSVLDRSSDLVERAAAGAVNIFEASANILSNAIDQYGPTTIEGIMWIVRIDALQVLVNGWFWLFMVVGSWWWFVTGIIRRDWIDRLETTIGNESSCLLLILGGILSVVTVAAFLSKIIIITNIWLYVALVKPELYVAKQAVDVVIAKMAPEPKK